MPFIIFLCLIVEAVGSVQFSWYINKLPQSITPRKPKLAALAHTFSGENKWTSDMAVRAKTHKPTEARRSTTQILVRVGVGIGDGSLRIQGIHVVFFKLNKYLWQFDNSTILQFNLH